MCTTTTSKETYSANLARDIVEQAVLEITCLNDDKPSKLRLAAKISQLVFGYYQNDLTRTLWNYEDDTEKNNLFAICDALMKNPSGIERLEAVNYNALKAASYALLTAFKEASK